MKVITFAGGLNNNAFTPKTVIDEKQQRIDGFLIHDWDRRSHGDVTMQWVLDDSLNNGAIDAEKMEGQNAFYNNLLAFGIGRADGGRPRRRGQRSARTGVVLERCSGTPRPRSGRASSPLRWRCSPA